KINNEDRHFILFRQRKVTKSYRPTAGSCRDIGEIFIRDHLPESKGVLYRMTLGVVIEIDVYVSSFLRQAGYQSGILRELLLRIAGSVARGRTVTPDVRERSERGNFATKFWRIGQTNCPARLLHEVVDLIGEPALMAQFYYHPETFPPRQRAAQAIEAVAVRFHLRRKLKQYGSSFVAESR